MSFYTPVTNPYLFGFEDLTQTFMRCVGFQKMPQSLLLYGPKGIGKATFAYHLARYLFQEQPDTFKVDITSSLFAQVAQGSYDGLKVIDRNSTGFEKRLRTVSIDTVRQGIQFLHTTRSNGGWRVMIVDSVDELHPKAANALLKSLEEPSQKTLIILIAHSLGRVLPTLKSRCQVYGQTGLAPLAMSQALDHLLPEAESSDHELLQTYGMGCPGRMVALQALGGASFYNDFLNIMKNLIRDDLRPALTMIEGTQNLDDKDDFLETFHDFFSWWLMRLISPLSIPLKRFPEEKIIFEHLKQKHPGDFWLDFWSSVTDLLYQTQASSLDLRAVLTSLFYDMMQGKMNL